MNKALLISSISTLLVSLLFVTIMPIQQATGQTAQDIGTLIRVRQYERMIKEIKEGKYDKPAAKKVSPKARATQKRGNYLG